SASSRTAFAAAHGARGGDRDARRASPCQLQHPRPAPTAMGKEMALLRRRLAKVAVAYPRAARLNSPSAAKQRESSRISGDHSWREALEGPSEVPPQGDQRPYRFGGFHRG